MLEESSSRTTLMGSGSLHQPSKAASNGSEGEAADEQEPASEESAESSEMVRIRQAVEYLERASDLLLAAGGALPDDAGGSKLRDVVERLVEIREEIDWSVLSPLDGDS